MRALLGLIGERGFQISALYPATLALYQSLGWEIAGSLGHLTIPSHSLRSLVAPDPALPRDDTPARTPPLRMLVPSEVPDAAAPAARTPPAQRSSGASSHH